MVYYWHHLKWFQRVGEVAYSWHCSRGLEDMCICPAKTYRPCYDVDNNGSLRSECQCDTGFYTQGGLGTKNREIQRYWYNLMMKLMIRIAVLKPSNLFTIQVEDVLDAQTGWSARKVLMSSSFLVRRWTLWIPRWILTPSRMKDTLSSCNNPPMSSNASTYCRVLGVKQRIAGRACVALLAEHVTLAITSKQAPWPWPRPKPLAPPLAPPSCDHKLTARLMQSVWRIWAEPTVFDHPRVDLAGLRLCSLQGQLRWPQQCGERSPVRRLHHGILLSPCGVHLCVEVHRGLPMSHSDLGTGTNWIYRYTDIYTQHVQSPKTACHPPSSAGIHTTITFKRWMFPWMTPYIYGRSSLHTTQKTIDISIGNKNPKTLLIFQYVLYIFNHIFIHFSWCVYPLSFSSHSIWGFLGAQIFPLPLRCPWRTFTSGGELVKAPGIQQVIMSWSSWYHDG